MKNPHKNKNRPVHKRIVYFGKYAGKRYGELPDGYLWWLANKAFTRHDGKPSQADRVIWAREEIERRKS